MSGTTEKHTCGLPGQDQRSAQTNLATDPEKNKSEKQASVIFH